MLYLKSYESFDSNLFKKWFGNSKMVDSNGNPKVFYHGVGKFGKFDNFNKEFIGGTSGNYGHFGTGFYFIDSKSGAENFSEFYGGTGEVLSVYLKVDKPFYANEENLIKLGEKYKLNLPPKVDLAIDIDDLLLKLKQVDKVAYELLLSISKHKDYSKGWEEFLSRYKGDIPVTKLDLNNVGDWYEDTIIEKYGNGVSENTIKELKEIGIIPKIIKGYNEDIRLDYLTNLGEYATDWTMAIRKEGYDGVVAGNEYVVFEPNQIKSVDNKGTFDSNSDNINESIKDNIDKFYYLFGSLIYIKDIEIFGNEYRIIMRKRDGKERIYVGSYTDIINDFKSTVDSFPLVDYKLPDDTKYNIVYYVGGKKVQTLRTNLSSKLAYSLKGTFSKDSRYKMGQLKLEKI